MAQKVDWGLKFYRDVLKLDALHFGYWDFQGELTVENFRKAQERYTENLVSFIPAGVKKILDIGCGTGVVARRLKDAGFDVTSITPDAYQAELFRLRNPDVAFRRVRLEDFKTDDRYDLTLFSESFQYIDPDEALVACASLLRDGGYTLVSDYFRKTPELYYRTCHTEKLFLDAVSRASFAILESRDITEKTAPTLSLGSKLYKEYALPVMEIIAGYARSNWPLAVRAVSAALYFPLKKVRLYLYERMSDKLDAEKFKRLMAYKIYLLKKI